MWNYLDWGVIAIYFMVMMGIGYFFSKRVNSSEDYFHAGQRIPAWVTACSIYATMLSSISFLALPASIYSGGVFRGLAPIGIIAMIFWCAYVFVPFFRRINVGTGYEYLEKRFDRNFRFVSSASFILFHVIRIAVVLYIPIIAIHAVMPGINPILVTAVVALFCVSYTSVGGIEAVVWSDAIQTIVLLIGALLIIYFGFSAIPEGQSAFEVLTTDGTMIPADGWGFNLSGTTFVGMIIGGFLGAIYSYIGSQDIIQRYSITASEEEAKKSLFLNAPLLLTSTFIFIGMGSALYVFFKVNGAPPATIKGTALLPYFVVHYIPPGLGGLIIAAVFAAAQSTVSSSLNSLSTCITLDFYGVFNKSLTDEMKLKIGKISSWLVGLISSLIAIQFIIQGQGDMFLYWQAIVGLLGGPVAGVFLLGIFCDRVNNKAAWIGFITSILASIYVGDPMKVLSTLIPGYTKPAIFEILLSLVTLISCIVPAYVASFFLKAPNKENIEGLTYSSVMKKNNI